MKAGDHFMQGEGVGIVLMYALGIVLSCWEPKAGDRFDAKLGAVLLQMGGWPSCFQMGVGDRFNYKCWESFLSHKAGSRFMQGGWAGDRCAAMCVCCVLRG